METKQTTQPQLTRALLSKAAANRIPLSGVFELTARCNLNCKMCYVRLSDEQVRERGRERTEKEWLYLAEEARKEGMLLLLLTGGEPFMLPHFKSLYTELAKMGFIITVNSNGTLIDEKCVEWLSKIPPSKMRVTLYGGNDATYANLCRREGMFDKTVNALKLLKAADILTQITMTVTPYNAADYEQIADIADDIGIPLQASSYIFPPYRRDGETPGIAERLSPDEAARMYVMSDLRAIGSESFETVAKYRMSLSDSIDIAEEECVRDEKHPLRCHAGRSTFWVDWNGGMTPCGMMEYPKANPFEEGFKTAWDKIVSGTEELMMPPQCKNCKYSRSCVVCGAALFCETGTFGVLPNYCCEMAKATDKYTREAYEKIKKGE